MIFFFKRPLCVSKEKNKVQSQFLVLGKDAEWGLGQMLANEEAMLALDMRQKQISLCGMGGNSNT